MRKIWVNNIPIDGGKPTTTSIVWTINPIVVYDYWPPPFRALWYTIDVDHIIKWYVMSALTIYMCEIITNIFTDTLWRAASARPLRHNHASRIRVEQVIWKRVPPTPTPPPPTPPPHRNFENGTLRMSSTLFKKKNSFYSGNCFVVYIQPPYIPGPCFN